MHVEDCHVDIFQKQCQNIMLCMPLFLALALLLFTQPLWIYTCLSVFSCYCWIPSSNLYHTTAANRQFRMYSAIAFHANQLRHTHRSFNGPIRKLLRSKFRPPSGVSFTPAQCTVLRSPVVLEWIQFGQRTCDFNPYGFSGLHGVCQLKGFQDIYKGFVWGIGMGSGFLQGTWNLLGRSVWALFAPELLA